jgi:hypothetical protein
MLPTTPIARLFKNQLKRVLLARKRSGLMVSLSSFCRPRLI